MSSRRSFLAQASLVPAALACAWADGPAASPLDPRGAIHIPIGIPNTLDTLKTFVEAEGCFSPGLGSYGIYFWLWDADSRKLWTPAMEGVSARHGLADGGLLLPWSEWTVDGFAVRTEVCQVRQNSPRGEVLVVGARAGVASQGAARRVALYAALRPLGPAGWDVRELDVGPRGDLLLVDGHSALVADRKPSAAGVVSTDTIGELATSGAMPADRSARSAAGDCSGALRFDGIVAPGRPVLASFICPVLPGRRAARHHWVDLKQNAMVDQAPLDPPEGGIAQPDPGPAYYRAQRPDALFEKANAYWTEFLRRIDILMPDPRWSDAMRAILGHVALCMNEGAPDVAVVNYNVFNRDGMYIANIVQKSGLKDYSEQILDYFTRNPFNGRAYPEADNPGQILWAIDQHWLLTRDEKWLTRIYPSVRKIAAMIRYYRITPPPHWVGMKSLEFGEALPAADRLELQPGRCDGFHPEYTEAFDVAGLRGASELAAAAGNRADAGEWGTLAEALFATYDQQFGARLRRQYGSYSVLWPCRLYPFQTGKAFEQFKAVGPQPPKSWRYFPLATAHQAFLTGDRVAGCETLRLHLDHPQMQGWYAFDEGGGSGSGGWHRLRTAWPHSNEKPGENRSVAMPHGWALAEFWLLMRDCLVHEDGERLILLAGVSTDWFRSKEGMRVRGLPTYFGTLDFDYRRTADGAEFQLGGSAAPPGGHVLRLPPELAAVALQGNEPVAIDPNGDCRLSLGTRRVTFRF
jgi:hypothetical protein